MHSPRRFALVGTLDEYGDIRSRPSRDAYAARARTSESRDTHSSHVREGTLSSPAVGGEPNFHDRENAALGNPHDFETDMFQWPFIDGSWSLGFDTGFDGLWSNSGLFDLNPSLR